MDTFLETPFFPPHQKFQLGDVLVEHDQLTQYHKPTNQIWFMPLSSSECLQLEIGHEVWLSIITDNVVSRKLIRIDRTIKEALPCNHLATLVDEELVYGWVKDEERAYHKAA